MKSTPHLTHQKAFDLDSVDAQTSSTTAYFVTERMRRVAHGAERSELSAADDQRQSEALNQISTIPRIVLRL